ncbi:hypothetical protein AVEN_3253-1 [Araneus ventricosus]|uniref:Uncharacterized protein n=1 Tax=Araneus ventricosus TaxID=182803 RepID=A0A4Y2FNE0_ARAVE|nr:hypothetical protein AVEN_3253-1 [Araneus ventricosus]
MFDIASTIDRRMNGNSSQHDNGFETEFHGRSVMYMDLVCVKYGMVYCPIATRKTIKRVASSRRVEERRETGIKSTAIFGKLSAL